MSEILTIEEIKTRYPDEWVLVENPEVDEHLNVIRGTVIYHNKDREAMYDQAIASKAASVASIFTGKTPKGMVFAL